MGEFRSAYALTKSNVLHPELFFTQHPLRQRKDMMEFEMNHFSLNYRIHPLTAESILDSFDGALQLLEDRKSRYNGLHQAILGLPVRGLGPVVIGDGVEHSWHRYSPRLLSSLDKSEHEKIEAFLAEHGYAMEDRPKLTLSLSSIMFPFHRFR